MNVSEKAKEAREKLMETDPGFVAGIDGLKQQFGARLTVLVVDDISIGNIESFKIWDEAPPFAPYRRPEERAEEWKQIRGAIGARITAGLRASGRKR